MKKKLYEVVDGSFTLQSAGENGMYPSHGIGLKNRRFEIVAKNCKLPSSGGIAKDEINDTIIRDVDNGEVVFIQTRMIRPLTGTCPHCGETIKAM